jgi:hypothetical protein
VLLLVFPEPQNLYLGTSGAKPEDCPCSYTFLLIHLCRNVTVCFNLCFSRQLRCFCEKKLTKKIIFYCDDEALKVFRKYRCHPGSVYRNNLISYLIRKNEEIRGKRLGRLYRSMGNAIPKQGLNGAMSDG